MKLIIIDRSSLGRKSKTDVPLLSLNRTGQVVFNQRAVEVLSLYDGCSVDFFQDTEDLKQWYVGLSPKQTGFTCKKYANYRGVSFSNKPLCGLILESLLSLDKSKSHRFSISKEAVQYGDRLIHAVITSKSV